MKNNTKEMPEVQVLDVKIKQVRLRIANKRIAKEMKRTEAAISKAYSGKSVKLLHRISRYLDRMERVAAEKAARTSQTTPQQISGEQQ